MHDEVPAETWLGMRGRGGEGAVVVLQGGGREGGGGEGVRDRGGWCRGGGGGFVR